MGLRICCGYQKIRGCVQLGPPAETCTDKTNKKNKKKSCSCCLLFCFLLGYVCRYLLPLIPGLSPCICQRQIWATKTKRIGHFWIASWFRLWSSTWFLVSTKEYIFDRWKACRARAIRMIVTWGPLPSAPLFLPLSCLPPSFSPHHFTAVKNWSRKNQGGCQTGVVKREGSPICNQTYLLGAKGILESKYPQNPFDLQKQPLL